MGHMESAYNHEKNRIWGYGCGIRVASFLSDPTNQKGQISLPLDYSKHKQSAFANASITFSASSVISSRVAVSVS